MIYTSCFKNYEGINAVSIAGSVPNYYFGRQYKLLAPKWWFFQEYKKTGNQQHYIEHYHKEVLDKLDPNRVYSDLGKNAVILCWEESGFCHRHLVAKWLNDNLNLGYIIEEYKE